MTYICKKKKNKNKCVKESQWPKLEQLNIILSYLENILLEYSNAKGFDCVDHNKLWKILKEMGIPDHMT